MVWVSTGRNGEGAARGALLWLVLGLYVQGNRAVTGSNRAVPASVKPGKAALPGSQQRREPELLRSPSGGRGRRAAPGRGRPLLLRAERSGAELAHPAAAGEGASPRASLPREPPWVTGAPPAPSERVKARSRRDSRLGFGGGGDRRAPRGRAFAGKRGRPETSNAGRGGKQKRGSLLNRFLRSNGSRGEGLDWKSKFQDNDQSALWRPRTV